MSALKYLTQTVAHTHVQRVARIFIAASFVSEKFPNLRNPCWWQGLWGPVNKAQCVHSVGYYADNPERIIPLVPKKKKEKDVYKAMVIFMETL